MFYIEVHDSFWVNILYDVEFRLRLIFFGLQMSNTPLSLLHT